MAVCRMMVTGLDLPPDKVPPIVSSLTNSEIVYKKSSLTQWLMADLQVNTTRRPIF